MSDATNPGITAAEVEAAIDEHAAAFDVDRKKRAKSLADAREKKNRRVQRQLFGLFLLLTCSFILLAYRTEVNYRSTLESDHKIEVATYQGCMARVALAEQANKGREVLINLVLTNPARTQEARLLAAQQLRDGLLLPVEDCGPAPDGI